MRRRPIYCHESLDAGQLSGRRTIGAASLVTAISCQHPNDRRRSELLSLRHPVHNKMPITERPVLSADDRFDEQFVSTRRLMTVRLTKRADRRKSTPNELDSLS